MSVDFFGLRMTLTLELCEEKESLKENEEGISAKNS